MQRPCVRVVECRVVAVACRIGAGRTVGVDWGVIWGVGGGKEEKEAAINGIE